MTDEEFIDKLRYAFQCGWEASLETKLLAVARVALERAAEVVRNKGRKWHGDLDENKSLDDLADDILALIPKEPTT